MSKPALTMIKSKPCTKEEYEKQTQQALDIYFKPVNETRPPRRLQQIQKISKLNSLYL